MPAHIGVLSSFLPAPAGGYVHESTRETSIEVDPVKDSNGVTVAADLKPLVTMKVTIKGVGDPGLASVAAGAINTGTLFIVSAKRSETNEKRPEFEISAVGYSNLRIITRAMPADFTKIGIQSVGITLAQKFDIEKKLEDKVLLDQNGQFVQGDARDPMFEFSIEGKGDLPAGLVVGSGGVSIQDIGGGKTIIKQITETEKNDDWNEWKASGVNYPIRNLSSSMQEGQTIRFVRGEGSPLQSPTLGLVAAALACGIRFAGDKPLLDTLEDREGDPLREFIWTFDDRSKATFRPKFCEETLTFEEFRQRFEDLAWCEKNPDHPIAFLRVLSEKLAQLRTSLRTMKPLLKIRKGRATALIPPDASPEDKAKILAQL